ncbi:hypothetical protein BO70DRAFT_366631 [Aspergillus heteromorphus CBS 117.55]|uniref:NAD(P)-binding domain-containing protein n=1 Tax=Aspergillus heteromorphus CBS 117.55 TaxID=1448321 RepID=A0A317UVC7_9EURO|nr:uncharacterized protein BO70DRAFT_366631 [Aspergillus heteromorphus CBS 117.55]PWY66013.1 hypothetical protein BO70DRAFT_366631 [Aspergillus heteromorphus CBS 117.55]
MSEFLPTLPTFAFFGSTGGCINACLALTLKAGYQCTARTRAQPPKLHDLLRKLEVPESAIANNLVMIQGNITDLATVQQALSLHGRTVDMIISGIGGKFLFKSGFNATIDNPTICQDATRTILEAARTCYPKPRFVVMSGTGIGATEKRDMPCLMKPMYNILLKVPHADKEVMEKLVLAELDRAPADRAFEDFMLVRPSFLTDGESDGMAKIRAGTESNPAVGYIISRSDVGLWLFESVVRKAGPGQNSPFWGQRVSITI